jgi:hypothetical protein
VAVPVQASLQDLHGSLAVARGRLASNQQVLLRRLDPIKESERLRAAPYIQVFKTRWLSGISLSMKALTADNNFGLLQTSLSTKFMYDSKVMLQYLHFNYIYKSFQDSAIKLGIYQELIV